MARLRSGKASQNSKHQKSGKGNQKSSISQKSATTDPYALLAQAAESLQTGDAEGALPSAQEAVSLLTSSEAPSPTALSALTLLGQIQIELGKPDAAREAFVAAATLDPDGSVPEEQGGGAEKFLWLGQLSEDGGEDSIKWFEFGATVLEREIAVLRVQPGKEEDLEDRIRKLSSALCGMIEVWMTDLSYVLFSLYWIL